MSVAELRITYRPDDDGTGQITATARSGAFSGQGSAWGNPDSVKHAFVAGLRAFPLTSASPPTVEGGFWSREKQGSLDQCHLRITIKPLNTRGTLPVHLELASEVQKTPDADLQNCATIRFLAEYEAVRGFAEQLERVLYGESEEAVLKGFTN